MFLQKVPKLVKAGKPVYILVKWFDGGLGKAVSDGFECIASGEGSAEKIVLTVTLIPFNLIRE